MNRASSKRWRQSLLLPTACNAVHKVEQRLVTTGATDGDLVVVSKGLAEGDSVIVGNLQKIGPGSPVKPIEQKPASPGGAK